MSRPESQSRGHSTRRDGWTPARQLRFLDVLAHTRSVTAAARAAGMSRTSAYRLRARDPNGLFAAAWDRAFERPALGPSKGHGRVNFASWRKARKSVGFPGFSMEGYEVHDPLFSPPPRSTS